MQPGSWRREEDMVQVLGSPLFISYHHHHQMAQSGTHHVICTSSRWSWALPAMRYTLCDKTSMPRVTLHLCLPWSWEHCRFSSVSLLLCELANLEPRCPRLCPCKALKKLTQTLRSGRRAQLGSHTAGIWGIHSCACHTLYRLPCGHTPAKHSQWVSPCRFYTGSPPEPMVLLPL